MSHGYENVGTDEIRDRLTAEFAVIDPEILKQTKLPLIALLQEYIDKQEEDAVDNVVEEDDSVLMTSPDDVDQEEAEPHMPHISSPQWQDYVMRQFMDEELMEGNPTCDGCRRVVEELIGPLFHYGVSEYTPASVDNKGTATVVYAVNVVVTQESHPMYGKEIVITEIADSGPHNTDVPYCNHAAATAATRAESRCYRKLLRLRNTITAEEYSEQAEQFVDGTNWAPDNPIDENQISVMNLMCQRQCIDVMSFINSGQAIYTSIEMVPQATAQKMLQELNKFQRGVKAKPTNLKPYNPDWRKNESTN